MRTPYVLAILLSGLLLAFFVLFTTESDEPVEQQENVSTSRLSEQSNVEEKDRSSSRVAQVSVEKPNPEVVEVVENEDRANKDEENHVFTISVDDGKRIDWTQRTPAARICRPIECEQFISRGKRPFAQNEKIVVPLFGDDFVEAYVRESQLNVAGAVGTTAVIEEGNGRVYLSTHEGKMLALIKHPAGKRDYRIQYDLASGEHVLMEIDWKASNISVPCLGGPAPVPMDRPEKEEQAVLDEIAVPGIVPVQIDNEVPVKADADTAPSRTVTVDIMVVYTTPAKTWATNNESGIANNITLSMQLGNDTHTNSQTGITLNLVHSAEVTDYTADGTDPGVDLDELTTVNGDNYLDGNPCTSTAMDAVQGWRDTYGADFVSLFLNEPNTGGLGWRLNDAAGKEYTGYNLNRVQQTSSTYTQVHEIGHNMGCQHSKTQVSGAGVSDQTQVTFTFAAGWQWDDTGSTQASDGYCSVLTYENFDNSSGTGVSGREYRRVAYFSDPDTNYTDGSTNAVGDSVDGDNARAIRLVQQTVAVYRGTHQAAGAAIASFPYSESFEGGLGAWYNVTDDDGDLDNSNDVDWTPGARTVTTSSGPSDDQGSDGIYAFVEGSSNLNKTASMVATLDLTALSTADISFYYHMYGSTMGGVYLDVSTNSGTNWTNLWNITGQQHTAETDAWTQATQSLDAYAGSSILLRFRGEVGTNFASDMALDTLSITGTAAVSDPQWSASYPAEKTITAYSASAKFKTPEAGTVYYVVLTDGATAPTSAQVKAGKDASDTLLDTAFQGNVTVVADTEKSSKTMLPLTHSTAYDIYAVIERTSDSVLQASPTKIDITTSGENNNDTYLGAVWSGGVTDTQAVVVARAKDVGSDHTATLWISTSTDMSGAVLKDTQTAASANDGIVKLTATGLSANTAYYYQVKIDGNVSTTLNGTDYHGTFTSFPTTGSAANFNFAFACSNSTLNSSVYDKLAVYNPLFFIHTGDFHYEDVNSSNATVARDEIRMAYKKNWNILANASRQSSFYRQFPIAYMWDDHDFGPNDAHAFGSSATHKIKEETRVAVHAAYRAYVPHYDLGLAGDSSFTAGEEPICQAFTVGRVRILLSDIRSQSEQNGTTAFDAPLLGTRQKAWLKEELLRASGTYPLIVWLSTTPWNGPKDTAADANKWYNHTDEREEISEFLLNNNIQGFCAIAGDMHATCIDDGINTDFVDANNDGTDEQQTNTAANFPLFHAASIGTKTSYKGGPYNRGASQRGNQYGRFEVTDDGSNVSVTWKGWDCTTDAVAIPTQDDEGDGLVQYSFTRNAPVLTVMSPVDEATAVALSGNLQMTFNKNVTQGTGSILIKNTDGSTAVTIAVSSVTGWGSSTIALPYAGLSASTTYYVEIPSTAIQAGSDYFSGMYNPLTSYKKWNFTTDAAPSHSISFPDGISLFGYAGADETALNTFQSLITANNLVYVRTIDVNTGITKDLYYDVASGSWKDEIGTMTAGRGYIVKITTGTPPVSLVINGARSSSEGAHSLPAGYSLIGYRGTVETASATTAFSDVTAASTNNIVRWVDETGATKELYHNGSTWVNDIGTLKKDQSYVIKLENATTVTIHP